VLRQLPKITDPNLLVGVNAGDDAAVYRMDGELALIQTLDFFPPIVDDPFTYGEVAVANALSDVYAMGGRPILAMNIVGFPVELPKEILGEVLKGGASKAQEAGVLIVGGHTVDDKEPKYGLAVTGVIKPGLQVTAAGAKTGDALVLTKPIGTGIITTAGKEGRVRPEVLDNAVRAMSVLNRAAAEAMMRVGVNACVDVTGFGLLGHLRVMLDGSDVAARLELGKVPVLEGARELLEKGIAPGGTHRNLDSVAEVVRWHPDLDEETRLLLCDAQTSGGLLISVAPERLDELIRELKAGDVQTTAVIGGIVDKSSLGGARVEVLP
jgi:selenide,water dikinase